MRELDPGIGRAVAERTILRKTDRGVESWADVAERVAYGNSLLCKNAEEQPIEYEALKKHIGNATLLMSGRHLQHGDKTQPSRNQEVFTNCSTAATSFAQFYLLLNGSGVGRCYDDDMMLVNWDNMPNILCVLDDTHPDFDHSAHESVRDAKHKYSENKDVLWHKVEDTREGWAKALEILENSAFQKIHKDKIYIIDFSMVRPRGSLIKGMQNRPASGPVPLMNAFNKIATLKGSNLDKWLQAMYVDHYSADCVLVGGARRAARMSTKTWRDKSVLSFIGIKRPIEFQGMNLDETIQYRKESMPSGGFLWSSNNSVTVDKEFWRLLSLSTKDEEYTTELARHARKVFDLVTKYSYGDGTGEPGFINEDKLEKNKDGLENLVPNNMFKSSKYQIEEETELYFTRLVKRVRNKKNCVITNPCGEIVLFVHGGFCVILDTAPYHADHIYEVHDAMRTGVRSLIRVNTMDSVYKEEVSRTNRIGVGMTGVHEFAWKFFGYGFRDLIDEEKSMDFWVTLSDLAYTVEREAVEYSKKLGVSIPHTMRTVKPAGSTSKLFNLTEGWHLPAMRWYMRWVQFRQDDPLVEVYANLGYPTRVLKKYKNTAIVGFPTAPEICKIMPEDKIVTASEATPEEQYRWLMLGEKYWIQGGAMHSNRGNQISYTLKYDTKNVSYLEFKKMMKEHQSQIRCCSVMEKTDNVSYEYLPEQPISKEEYETYVANIKDTHKLVEDIGKEHIDCENGACPVDFNAVKG